MSAPNRSQAAELLSEILGVPVPAEGEFLRADCPSWDSLKHIEVVMGFEDEYEVRFSADEMASISSLDDLLSLVGRA